jgi:thymidine phosphorylase
VCCQEVDEAIALAQSMLAAGEASGKQTTAFVTSMNEPIGRELTQLAYIFRIALPFPS